MIQLKKCGKGVLEDRINVAWHAFIKHDWGDSELEHRSTTGQCLGEDDSWN